MSLKHRVRYFKGLSTTERFFKNVEKSDGCWAWTGAVIKYGYGTIMIKKKLWLAHRLSLVVHGIDLPKKMDVCHKCDNPNCVNPTHLFLGTHQDNMIDMVQKGRANRPFGAKHANHVLSDDNIREIRSLNMPARAIAKMFNVSHPTILSIKNKKTWKHII